jgi:hypothetical protein
MNERKHDAAAPLSHNRQMNDAKQCSPQDPQQLLMEQWRRQRKLFEANRRRLNEPVQPDSPPSVDEMKIVTRIGHFLWRGGNRG